MSNFIHTSLTFLRSFAELSLRSPLYGNRSSGGTALDFLVGDVPAPLHVKRETFLEYSCCQVLLNLAASFFVQIISLPSTSHLVCLSPISYIILVTDVLVYCHHTNSTENLYNYKCLCTCIYLHVCVALVWIVERYFKSEQIYSWPCACRCRPWGANGSSGLKL